VNKVLDEELSTPGLVHALQLHTRTPEEAERLQAAKLAKNQAAAAANRAVAPTGAAH